MPLKVDSIRKVTLDFTHYVEIFCKVKEINLKEAYISFEDNPILMSAKKSNSRYYSTKCFKKQIS